MPITDEQLRNGINVIPPAARPRVILRYADTRDLLVSGLVENGGEIAQHAAVVDVPLDKGHVVAFSNNPIWRGETQGSYFLVFNALLNFDQLDAGTEAGFALGGMGRTGRDGQDCRLELASNPAHPTHPDPVSV